MGEGYVFTSICPQEGGVSGGWYVQGVVYPEECPGVCVWGVMCPGGGVSRRGVSRGMFKRVSAGGLSRGCFHRVVSRGGVSRVQWFCIPPPPRDTANRQSERILLEYILVF